MFNSLLKYLKIRHKRKLLEKKLKETFKEPCKVCHCSSCKCKERYECHICKSKTMDDMCWLYCRGLCKNCRCDYCVGFGTVPMDKEKELPEVDWNKSNWRDQCMNKWMGFRWTPITCKVCGGTGVKDITKVPKGERKDYPKFGFPMQKLSVK